VDTVDHGKRVLAVILIGRSPRALAYAQRRLALEHFPDRTQQALFGMAENYASQTGGGVLTLEAVEDALHDAPPGRAALYREYWEALKRCLPEGRDGFIHSVNQLRERAAERLTGEALAQGREVLTTGAEDGQRLLKGHADARAWVMSEFARIERELAMADSPEGDMRAERDELAAQYSAAEASRRNRSDVVATGLPSLDVVLGGGLRRGELDFLLAFTSIGKTGLCCQVAWDAVVRQGKNVVFFTTETLRSQVRIKIMSRHSRLFAPAGVNSRDIRAGTLSRSCPFGRHEAGCGCGREVYQATIDDFTTKPGYGHLNLAQVPRGATVATVDARLKVISREWEADLVIIDYLMLLRSDTAYRSKRETLAEIVNEAKALATGYRDGRGVPVLSPWQVNKEGWQAAKASGYYDLDSAAETAEARNTADLVMSMLLTETTDSRGGRAVPIKLEVLKNRDGERGSSVELLADYATSHFAEVASARAEDVLVDITGGPE
jgi:replicative DNA helicase